MSSVNLMIDYMVKHQNSHVFADLFYRNFAELANKGATLKPLLESAIINFSFDYNEWPSTHADTTRMIRPFNGSL